MQNIEISCDLDCASRQSNVNVSQAYGFDALKIHVTHGLCIRPLYKSVYWKYYFLYFSYKSYVVGTQKNRLNEMVLLSTQNTCLKLIGKKIIAIFC